MACQAVQVVVQVTQGVVALQVQEILRLQAHHKAIMAVRQVLLVLLLAVAVLVQQVVLPLLRLLAVLAVQVQLLAYLVHP